MPDKPNFHLQNSIFFELFSLIKLFKLSSKTLVASYPIDFALKFIAAASIIIAKLRPVLTGMFIFFVRLRQIYV